MSKRMSLILADSDARRIDPFVRPGTDENAALRRWASERGIGFSESEAAALRLLLSAGVEALTEAVLDAAYADVAIVYHDVDHSDERRAMRDRLAARRAADQ
jgi:hypothetical protein